MMRKKLPWVELGGRIPVVAMSGRNIIQEICHEYKKKFIAEVSEP